MADGDRREEERADLEAQLGSAEPEKLGIQAVPSDGNCLYSALSHQLTRLRTLPWGLPLGPGQGSISEWLDDHPLLELAEVPESGLSPGLDALPMTVEALRAAAADHLAAHRDDFEPFLTVESDADGEALVFEDYCERVRSSNEWGRQLELRALADALEVQILVYSAGQCARPSPRSPAALRSPHPISTSHPMSRGLLVGR